MFYTRRKIRKDLWRARWWITVIVGMIVAMALIDSRVTGYFLEGTVVGLGCRAVFNVILHGKGYREEYHHNRLDVAVIAGGCLIYFGLLHLKVWTLANPVEVMFGFGWLLAYVAAFGYVRYLQDS